MFSTVKGLPVDAPTWLNLYDVTEDLMGIVVSKDVQDKWAPGAEILITSHTTRWYDQQERTIMSISDVEGEPDYVVLGLDLEIERPTTIKDDSDFAVEVALLSRNIVFEGGEDSNSFHGGHFWVMHTPAVKQHLEGVDFQNFGQQVRLSMRSLCDLKMYFPPSKICFPTTTGQPRALSHSFSLEQ